jgi:hypothetical protein
MNLLKESPSVGIQAIPPFAREATLIQNVQCWQDWGEEGQDFPAARSNYNVAALAFYPRLRMQTFGGGQISQTLGITFWSHAQRVQIPNVFGVSKVLIPQGAEYFSVAWLQPPDWSLASGPYPEEMFRIVWGLGL